ncbi:SusC/RagA family TonB-linked outer membrane protein [Flavobacterium aquicola]|uniref:TonB-linked SusC/RagA family outer membrane protein n=1 Tax=Flavobacterium aquicola TaxID=1682742 RepID=A0A3E0ECR6_9FLAO|nr:TonB-dependent receptor [Flavobacterium aquicola]REG94796.1 TonB-linked SusC/RagA family outer membrane protein [Flavobacterium aquicola]
MKKKWKNNILFCVLLMTSLTAFSQNTIQGIVSDENGLMIPGANISVIGSSKAVTTDFDGKYKIEANGDAVLSFSFIGFDAQKIIAAGRTTINVVLKSSNENLKEIVVIGYGSVKKADLTGSVSTVKTKALQDIPSNSIEQVLQGRVAGLQITTSQVPGSASTVRIRGGSSLRGSNSPLVVVDGFPLGDAGDLKQINVADIDKVDVLKDASASAIYGSRGANGVIIVTTKSAKKGKTQILVQQQSSFSEFNSELNLWRDPVLMAQLSNEGRINGGQTPLYIGAENSNGVYYPSVHELQSGAWPYFTKWDDITFRSSPLSNNTLVSINSGTDKTSFSLTGNYYSEQGVYVVDNYTKGGYNLRVKHDVFDNLTVRFSNILSKGNRKANDGLAYWRNPIFPVYDENGNYYMIGNNDYSHPVAITEKRQNETRTTDFITSGSLEWQVIPSLKLTTRLNYKLGSSINDQFYPSIYTETGDFNNGAGYINNWEGENFASETFANYNKTFGKHDLGVTGGFTYETYMSRNSNLGAFDFVNETLGNENMSAGNPERNTVSNGKTETKLVSGIFRVNYGYDDKYLVTLTGRADGSSKFGKNNQWAYFPSGAVSWKAHNEEFIKSLNTFDELKFRMSYGISGNQGISPYQTLSRYGVSQYYDNGNWVSAIGPGYQVGTTGQDGIEKLWGGIPNPDLKWETTAQSDFGVDVGILKNRLHLIFDLYSKNTKDLLRERILPVSSGYDRIWVNDGEITNKGFELTLDGDIIKNKDLTLSASLIYSKNNNEVVSLGSVEQSGLNVDPNTGMQYEYSGNSLEQFRQFPNILAVGQPINVFYGYKTEGIVQNLQEGVNAGLDGDLAQAGEFKYVDINKDGVIDTKDQTIIGNPNPDFTASFNLSLKYKQLDFSAFFNGAFGQDVLNTQAFNQPSNAPLRWTPDNPTNEYPSLRDGRTLKLSDWWIEDGSFVRIQNITVGYTLKPAKSVIQSLRLYLNANNVYTFTSFEGYDPEVGTDGIYWGGYPRLSKWTIGLDLTF